ncbi:MAG: hypothetical protein COA33_001520 [Fluviicola sp.]|nr:hypothetical protein [Fluviicola sp.]
MKSLILLIVGIISCSSLFAQEEIKYNAPPSKLKGGYNVEIKDIISTSEYCKLKLVVKNTSETQYFVLDVTKTGFEYDGVGVYYPKKGKKIVITPEDTKAKVIKIAGSMDYRVGTFNVLVNGLSGGIVSEGIALSALKVEIGEKSETNSNGLTLRCVKSSSKKGKVSVVFDVLFEGGEDELIVIDPSLFKISNSEGVIIENVSINKSKKVTLRTGGEHSIKMNFESETPLFEIVSSAVFDLVKLKPIVIDKFVVSNSSVQTVSSVPKSCPPFMGAKNGPVTVKIYNEEGTCFTLDIDGFPVISEYTSNALIYRNPGRQKLKFTLPNGTVLEEKVFISDNYDVVGYRLKEKGNGDFTVKYVARDQVLNAKGQHQRSEMMTRTKTTTNSSTNSGNTSGGGCYGAPSNGATTVKLKITWKGQPVVGHNVQIKSGGAIKGNNTSDSGGIASIKVGSLESLNLDVYGCKGSSKWSVTGDWVVLDGSNYFHLKLDEVASFMSEMMGITVDQIGASWGM